MSGNGLQPGENIGPRYVVIRRLGGGGFGAVYLARDTLDDDALAAVKVLDPHPANRQHWRAGELERRFDDEARRARGVAKLSQHAINVLDFGEFSGRRFLVMPYIRGRDAYRTVLDDGPMSAEAAVSVVEQVAQALDIAHRGHFLHRDVKPGNIMLADGPATFALLGDFGLHADLFTPSGRPRKISAAGTEAWGAPEAMGRSAHPIDRRADVYGLAAVLRFLLFRVLPADALPARPELPKRVHEGLIAVLERGLDPDPSRRQDTAGTLADQARAVLADHMRRMRSCQRIRRAMAGAAAVFALGGVGYVVTDGGRDGETDSGDTVINSAVAPRDDFRALDPVLDEAALAFKYLNEQVIESDEAAPAELLSRNDAVIARRKAVIARLSELRLTSDAAQRTQSSP
jgi:serine/threonine protein kinase